MVPHSLEGHLHGLWDAKADAIGVFSTNLQRNLARGGGGYPSWG